MSYKLYFRYGTMNSSKSMNLLMVAHNYENQNKKIIVIKPKVDTRFGLDDIKSRTGFRRSADIILDSEDILFDKYPEIDWKTVDCVLVDEAQFLTRVQIDEIRVLTLYTPVICYGLRTDYRSFLFPGSKRLMELADSIEEIKTICIYCSKKSNINMKYVNIDGRIGKVVEESNGKPDLGCEEKYKPVCWKCWHEHPVIQPVNEMLMYDRVSGNYRQFEFGFT